MTEAEYLASEDPAALLAWLTTRKTASDYRSYPAGWAVPSDRKLRLFGHALWTRFTVARHGHAPPAKVALDYEWIDDPSRIAAPHWNLGQLPAAVWASDSLANYTAARALPEMLSTEEGRSAVAAALLREIVGNPFRPFCWCGATPACQPHKCAMRGKLVTPTALSLAQAAYDERQPDGTLDPHRLAVLSDALEEAGCTSEELLMHLRGKCEACGGSGERREWKECLTCHFSGECGPHVRGCWALDLLLGNELANVKPRKPLASQRRCRQAIA